MTWTTTFTIAALLSSPLIGPCTAQEPAPSPTSGVRLVDAMPVDALQRSL